MNSREAVVGVYFGLMVVVVLFVLGASHPEWWTNTGFVYRFQTLIGAGVAVLAALIGGGAVYHQTRSARAREQRQDKVKESATRAILPHMLSRIVDYVEASVQQLRDMRASAKGFQIPRNADFGSPPTLPFDLLERLSVAAESAGPNAQSALGELLLTLQLQSSRLIMYTEATASPAPSSLLVLTVNIDGVALDTAEVFLRAERLYPYARGWSDDADAELTNRDLVVALDRLGYPVDPETFSFDMRDEWLSERRAAHRRQG